MKKNTPKNQSLTTIGVYAQNYDTTVDFDRHFIRYRFLTLMQHRKNLGAVLEMGCADGLMTKELLAASKSVDVVEGAEKYIHSAKKYLDSKAKDVRFYHSLFSEHTPDRKYDTILLSSVLHEVDDPVLVLKKAKMWLKKEGIMYINVPNATSLHRRIGRIMGFLKDEWAYTERDKTFLHQRIYDMKLLRGTVKKAGLKISKEGGFFLKCLSNAQLEKWDGKTLDAFYEVSKEIDPELCAEIYVFVK